MPRDEIISKDATSLSKKRFEKAIQIQNVRTMMDQLASDKRNLSKLMNAKSTSSSDKEFIDAMKEIYLDRYHQLESMINALEEPDQKELLDIFNLQKGFFHKIKPVVLEPVVLEETPQLDNALVQPALSSIFATTIEEEVVQEIPLESPIHISRNASLSSLDTDRSIETSSIKSEDQIDSSENDINQSKESARQAILNLYSESMVDDPALFLEKMLPVAYKKYFIIEDGRLEALGENKAMIEEALGLKNGKINLDEFSPKRFDELKSKSPSKAGLWSVLKSLTPIGPIFSAEDKVNACLDVVELISKSRIIKTQKTQHVLDVLGYASTFVHETSGALLKIQRLLTGVGKENDLLSWFKRKLNQHQYVMPERLVANIQINWLDSKIPAALKEQTVKIKKWLEEQQQQLVNTSNGVLKSINTNGCLIHFKPLQVACEQRDKNCYVWDNNELSYIDDDYKVVQIEVEDATRLNEAKKRYMTEGRYNITYKFLKESDLDYLVTSNTTHVRPPARFQEKRWLNDVEKEHREEACTWDSDALTSQPKEVGVIQVKYKTIYLVQGYYENEIGMLSHLDEFKSILESRLDEVKSGINSEIISNADQRMMEKYIENINKLMRLQIALREIYPVPQASATVESSLIALKEEFENPLFKQYMSALRDLGDYTEKFQSIMKNHPDFLSVRSIEGTNTMMEIRSKMNPDAYIQPIIMRIARIDDKLREISSLFKKISSSQAASANDTYNQFKVFKEYNSAKGELNLLQAQGNSAQDSAMKAMLSYKNVTYPSDYFRALLPVACPNIFSEEKGIFDLYAPDKYWRTIFEALGLDVNDKNNKIELDPCQFNAKALNALMDRYPNDRAIFSILKSYKPIDSNFSADDKVKACIELARLISEKKVVSSQKLQFVLNVLAHAYKEVEVYAKTDAKAQDAIDKIKELFGEKPLLENSLLQKWIKNKFEHRKSIVVPPVIRTILDSNVTNPNPHTHTEKSPLFNLALLAAKKIKYAISAENPDKEKPVQDTTVDGTRPISKK